MGDVDENFGSRKGFVINFGRQNRTMTSICGNDAIWALPLESLASGNLTISLPRDKAIDKNFTQVSAGYKKRIKVSPDLKRRFSVLSLTLTTGRIVRSSEPSNYHVTLFSPYQSEFF